MDTDKMDSKDLLELHNINFSYKKIQILHNINISIYKGEIQAIVGEHGAGKTSMIKIISGMEKSKNGFLVFNGKKYNSFSLKIARNIGISMVYQESLLNNYLTIAENILLADKAMPFFSINYKSKIIEQAQNFISTYEFKFNASTIVKNLNTSDRVVINILKALYKRPKLLILDEALEKLSVSTLDKVINLLLKLNSEGMSILFTTHRIDDIYSFAHRISVIKSGRILLNSNAKNIDKITLIKMAYTQMPDDLQQIDPSKEFYQLLRYNEAILQNLPISLIIIDTMFSLKMINNFCKKKYLINTEKYLNQTVNNFFKETNNSIISIINESLSMKEEKQFYKIEIYINSYKTISNLKIYPIIDGTTPIGSIIIIEDITEYTKMENQIVLSEKLASIGLLAAGVAHEINNPLEILYNYISYLKNHLKNNSLQKIIIEIQEEILHISDIVSNLVSFSEVKKYISDDVDINILLKSIIDLVNFSAIKQKIIICFNCFSSPVIICANKNEIKQVFLNLLKNSFEAMPDGGTININTNIKFINEEEIAEIEFIDSGIGINEKDLNQIFVPFFSTKKGANLGMGLSLCYKIIEKYNGIINVENMPSGKTMFRINFPLSKV